MLRITSSAEDLTNKWRDQIAACRYPSSIASRRGFVAMSIIDQSATRSEIVDIENLQIILLYDDYNHCGGPRNRVPLRLAGYRASRVPHGVLWGGAGNNRLYKDLALRPDFGARGQRIDRSKSDLMSLALTLDRRLQRAGRHAAAPWRGLRIPKLWAGFRPHEVRNLTGEGPEFEVTCRHRRLTASELFRGAARRIYGLVLFPMEWVSNELNAASAIFAELTPNLREQTCRVDDFPEGLSGYQDASEFSFFHNRYKIRSCDGKRFDHKRPRKLMLQTNEP